MPLKLPNLDDRRFKDLVEEGRSLIPTHAPEWTNHNPSEPGITLIELFAHLTEMMIYRLNRVTDGQKIKFLKLLRGPGWTPSADKTLTDEIRETMLLFRSHDRAVTPDDFEALALAADPTVARAKCVPRRNLESDLSPDRSTDMPGHVSVVIVPDSTGTTSPLPGDDLIDNVEGYMEERRLLTTVLHVVGPRYIAVGVQITLVLKSDALEDEVEENAVRALTDFFDPVPGESGKGWPFGRNVYVSEIYELLDQVPGVDYVKRKNDTEELTVDTSYQTRLIRNDQLELVGVALLPDELVNIQINPGDIDTILR